MPRPAERACRRAEPGGPAGICRGMWRIPCRTDPPEKPPGHRGYTAIPGRALEWLGDAGCRRHPHTPQHRPRRIGGRRRRHTMRSVLPAMSSTLQCVPPAACLSGPFQTVPTGPDPSAGGAILWRRRHTRRVSQDPWNCSTRHPCRILPCVCPGRTIPECALPQCRRAVLGRNGPDPPNAAEPWAVAHGPWLIPNAPYAASGRSLHMPKTWGGAQSPAQYAIPVSDAVWAAGRYAIMPYIPSICPRRCDSEPARAGPGPFQDGAAAYVPQVWQRIPRRPVRYVPRDAAGSPPVGGGIIAGAGTAPSRRPGRRIRPPYTRRGPPPRTAQGRPGGRGAGPPPKKAGVSARSGMREGIPHRGCPPICCAAAGAGPRPGAATPAYGPQPAAAPGGAIRWAPGHTISTGPRHIRCCITDRRRNGGPIRP